MMITSWKCRPRNSTGRFWLTELPYQIRPRRLQQSHLDLFRAHLSVLGKGFLQRPKKTQLIALLSLILPNNRVQPCNQVPVRFEVRLNFLDDSIQGILPEEQSAIVINQRERLFDGI